MKLLFFSFLLSLFFLFLSFFNSMERSLHVASTIGNVKWAGEILRENESINVNWKNPTEFDETALYTACYYDNAEIVALLLAHPNIDVNLKNTFGQTAFFNALVLGRVESVKLLLEDSRVDINERANCGSTPIHKAMCDNRMEAVEWLLASDRNVDLDSIHIQYKGYSLEDFAIAPLLFQYLRDPQKMKHKLRLKLGLFPTMASDFFSLIVFLCDGLLAVKEENFSNHVRFFKIAQQLPIELQMMLCYRMVGCDRTNIPSECSELQFRKLAKTLKV